MSACSGRSDSSTQDAGSSSGSNGASSGGAGSSSGASSGSGGSSGGTGSGSSSGTIFTDASVDGFPPDAHDAGASPADATTDGGGSPGPDAAGDVTLTHDSGGDAGAPADASTDAAKPRDASADAPDAAAVDAAIPSCTGATPSLKTDVYPILLGCGGELCHGALAFGPWGGAAGAHAMLVNAPEVRDGCDAGVLVAPGNVQKSYLINKLTGVGMCAGSMPMPRLGFPLPPDKIQTIADWICAGALNN